MKTQIKLKTLDNTSIYKRNSNIKNNNNTSIYKLCAIQVNWKKLQNTIELNYILWKKYKWINFNCLEIMFIDG